MIKNYLTTAVRIMLRQKGYSVINIVGLSMGIAASFLIMLYITDELSFDTFHRNGDRMYRVNFSGRLQGSDFKMASSPAPVAEAMMMEIPGVESAVRFGVWRTMPMSYQEKAFTEDYTLVADSNFFKFFSFKLLAGDPKNVLTGADKIVLTATAAKKYFGNENPIGKILLRGSEKKATEVTGVVEDAPANSHIKFDVILSGDSWDYLKTGQWTSNNSYTYFTLKPEASIEPVRKMLSDLAAKKIGAELEKIIGMSMAKFKESGNEVGLLIQRMPDIHLRSDLREEIIPNGNIQYLFIFGGIGVFIVLIACINFMNLSTARSASRAKEVGVRKTIGAGRGKLIGQFLSESMIYSFTSTLLALIIAAGLISVFNTLSGKSLTFLTLFKPGVLIGLVGFAVLIGVLAGSYPAFYLTSFNPVDVLKGKARSGLRNSRLRNGLVVFQFMISIGLILGSMVVYKQLRYMQEKNLGFDKENIIRLLHTWSLDTRAKAFKSELLSQGEFAAASYASDLPGHISWSNAFRKAGTDQDYLLNVCRVDEDHLATMKYTMVQGRFFSRDFKSDTAAIIINESCFKQMGFQNIENEFILNYNGPKPAPMKVIGVIKDFNYESLRMKVAPLALLLGGEPNGAMAIRLSAGNVRDRVQLLEKIWKKYSTGAFQFSFLDSDFDELFKSEERIGHLILIFTILTISIACLGLFGLATFVGEQRAKEISIRKVMGASFGEMIGLLFRDFTMLIIIAFAIAAPLGWYFMDRWLEGFAYRVNIDAGIFVVSGAASLAVAILTISYQSIKAASANPVVALKSE